MSSKGVTQLREDMGFWSNGISDWTDSYVLMYMDIPPLLQVRSES